MEFKNREIIENNFVCCLWKNPKIYNKYIKKIDELSYFFEFKTSEFYYHIGKKLVENGITVFDQATLLGYLEGNELIKEKFDSYGGYETYETIGKSLSSSNIDSFFNEILKMNVLNELSSKGFDIDGNWKYISQMSVDEIRAFYSHQLNDVFLKTGSETKIEDFSITDEDFETFNSGSQMGLSIASTSPLLNYEILGLNRGLSFVGGHVNQGKAQPLSAKVLTPTGWKTIGELKLRDSICGYSFSSGSYNKQSVIGIFPQGKKRVYQVYFSDGSSTKCNDEHLWTLKDNNGNWITKELKWFMENKSKSQHFYLPPRKKYNPDKKAVYKSMYDLFAIGYITGSKCNIKSGYLEFDSKDVHSWFMRSMERNIGNVEMGTSGDGELWNRLYKIKFTKEIEDWVTGVSPLKFMKMRTYINSKNGKQYVAFGRHMIENVSFEDRTDLLKGWLYSSSYRFEHPDHCKVRTENIPMLDFMVELARSCGWVVVRHSPRVAYFNKVHYRDVELIDIIDCGYEEEMVCIKVSGPTELYVTDDFIITHNTSFSFAVIVKAWINQKIKCCVISNEQTIHEFKQLMIAMVSYELFGEDGLGRRRLKIGRFNYDEREKFKQVAEKINKEYVPYLKFAKIFDYSIEDVEMIVETLSAQGYGGFIYDVFKADDSASGKVIGEMKEMSKSLFRLADKTNSSIVSTIQLGLSDLNVRYLGLDNVSTSKHITEPATEVLMIRQMWDDEVTGAKYDIKIQTPTIDSHGNTMKNSKGKTIMKDVPVGQDEYRNIKLVFLAKTRNTSLGICIAYKFDGAYNQWKELGYCYPSYDNRGKKQ